MVAGSAILLWAASVQGGPVELKHVAADATWLAHVDVDAARASKVVQAFVQECGKQCDKESHGLRERVEAIVKRSGLQHCKDLHGITAYGPRIEPHNGVVMIQADWNSKVLAEKAEKAPDHKTMEYGTYKIHTWTMHKCSKHPHTVAGVLYKPDLLVLGSSPELVKAALGVLDGKAANITTKTGPLTVKVSEGTIFLARAVGLNHAEVLRHCPVLHLIDQFDYQEGEHNGQWSGQLTVTAESKAVADDLKKVADGFFAMVSLHLHGQPKLVEILHHVGTTVDGNVATLSFHESADAMVAQMPAMCKFVAEHMKMYRHMWHKRHGKHHGWHGRCHHDECDR